MRCNAPLFGADFGALAPVRPRRRSFGPKFPVQGQEGLKEFGRNADTVRETFVSRVL